MSFDLDAIGIGPRDDDFHDLGDRWWATETSWFAFHHAERGIGGWLYSLSRQNVGTQQGGVWIWDDQAHEPWEVPYYRNLSSARLSVATSLRDGTLPVGWSIRVVEPWTRYHLFFEDGDAVSLDLTFDAVIPPQVMGAGKPPFLSAAHLDQFGRMTGSLALHGERLEIDCLTVRDRSWGPRPESHPRRLSYDFGIASPDHGFLCTTDPDHEDGDVVTHGFLLRDGHVASLAEGHREVTRDPDRGWILEERIVGTDEGGRKFEAIGTALSRIAVNRHTAVTWTSLMAWSIDGQGGHGEDQDMWPVGNWSAFRAGR